MSSEVNNLLAAARDGRDGAVDQLFVRVHRELHAIAENLLRAEKAGHTLQTTALVNEAYLRLMGREKAEWKDKAHFCAVAAQAMRRILVDHARKRKREKRGGGRDRVPLNSTLTALDMRRGAVDLIALNDALDRLAVISPRAAQVVEMRCFGGLTSEEIAAVLDVSLSTVEREWRYAKSWLYKKLAEDDSKTKKPPNDGHGARKAGR